MGIIDETRAQIQRDWQAKEAERKKANPLINALLAGGATYLTGGLASAVLPGMAGMAAPSIGAALAPTAENLLPAVTAAGQAGMAETTPEKAIGYGVMQGVEPSVAKTMGLTASKMKGGEMEYEKPKGIPALDIIKANLAQNKFDWLKKYQEALLAKGGAGKTYIPSPPPNKQTGEEAKQIPTYATYTAFKKDLLANKGNLTKAKVDTNYLNNEAIKYFAYQNKAMKSLGFEMLGGAMLGGE